MGILLLDLDAVYRDMLFVVLEAILEKARRQALKAAQCRPNCSPVIVLGHDAHHVHRAST